MYIFMSVFSCFRFFYLTLSICFLSLPALAQNLCDQPFDFLEQTESSKISLFFLHDKQDCSDSQKKHKLQISKHEDFYLVKNDSAYLAPDCFDTKVLNLYWGRIKAANNVTYDQVLDWSSNLKEGESRVFKISPTCQEDLKPLAILDTNSQELNLDEERAVPVSYVLRRNDLKLNLLAYVLSSEDNSNHLILRGFNSTKNILAVAKKDYLQDGEMCSGRWQVEIKDSVLSPIVMSYILAWKDNLNFSCDKKYTPPKEVLAAQGAFESGLRTSDVAGIVVGSVFLTAAITSYVCYKWQLPHKMRQAYHRIINRDL